MKWTRIIFGLLGITFLGFSVFFYYKPSILLESSYLQGDISKNTVIAVASVTSSCAGLHVELVSLERQVNETRKNLEEGIGKAKSLAENIDILKKKQNDTLTIINRIKAEKLSKESQTRKTQYTLNTIEKLAKELKTQEDIWNIGNNEVARQETELGKIQLTLSELREEINTFEKQIHAVEKDITNCKTVEPTKKDSK